MHTFFHYKVDMYISDIIYILVYNMYTYTSISPYTFAIFTYLYTHVYLICAICACM